jgi:hypothetical protein
MTSDGSAQFPAGAIVDPHDRDAVRNRRAHSGEPD